MICESYVDSLIQRIEVYNNDKSADAYGKVNVEIYFTAVGMVDIPTEKKSSPLCKKSRKPPKF